MELLVLVVLFHYSLHSVFFEFIFLDESLAKLPFSLLTTIGMIYFAWIMYFIDLST